MKQSSHYRRDEAIIVVACALALGVLAALGMWQYLNRDNRWVRIVQPPGETISEIIAADRGLNAYVRTRQGNLFLCGGSSWRDACRTIPATELPAAELPARWRTCDGPFPNLPPPPGVVVDALEAGQCSAASTYSKLILLNDGSLWQWRRTFSWANPFAGVVGVILGLSLGAAIGAVVVKLRRYLT